MGSALLGTQGETFKPYTGSERHNTLRHRQTDRQTDDNMMPIAGRTNVRTV